MNLLVEASLSNEYATHKVIVHINNDEMLTVQDWEQWVDDHLVPVVEALRQCPVFKAIYLAVGNEALAPWNVER